MMDDIDYSTYEEPNLWVLGIIIMCALLIPASFWLYDKSALGNPICEQMRSQGYYETEWDTAGYKDCKIIHEGNKWNPFETNQTCMEERLKTDKDNLGEYGYHCVWGGLGYWAWVGSGALLFMLLTPILMFIIAAYDKYKKSKTKTFK